MVTLSYSVSTLVDWEKKMGSKSRIPKYEVVADRL